MSAAAAALLSSLLLAARPAPGVPELGFTTERAGPTVPRLVFAPRPSPDATIIISFGAGSADDGDKPGLTRVAQRALVECSLKGSFESFVTDLYRSGAHFSIDTELKESAFVLTAPKKDFERLARQLSSMVLGGRFAPGLLHASIERTLKDEREAAGGSGLLELVARTVVEAKGFANEPLGRRETIEQVTSADVRAHLAGPLSPANATVVVAGSFDPRRLRAHLRAYRGGRQLTPLRPGLSLPFEARLPARRELHFLAYPVDARTPRTAAAFRVLAAMAEERLTRAFRDRGIGYSLGILPVHRSWADLLLVVLPAQGPVGSLSSMLFEEVGKLRDADAAQDFELNRARVAARLRAYDHSAAEVAEQLRRDGGLGVWYGPRALQALAELSPQDFTQIVKPWLEREAAFYTILSPTVHRPEIDTLRKRSEAKRSDK